MATIGILAQRLGRKIDSDNKEPYEVKAIDLRRFGFPVTDPDESVTLYRGVPAESNRLTGYKGRAALHELLQMNNEIRALCLTEAAAGPIRELGIKAGMRGLFQDGLVKVTMGVTTLEEVYSVSTSGD